MEPISNRDLRLPLVNVGSNKRPTYLPSHVCEVSRGQISNLKIEPSEMIKFAVRDPYDNAKSITNKAFKTLGLTSDNLELVMILLFRVIRDLFELIQPEMLWSIRG